MNLRLTRCLLLRAVLRGMKAAGAFGFALCANRTEADSPEGNDRKKSKGKSKNNNKGKDGCEEMRYCFRRGRCYGSARVSLLGLYPGESFAEFVCGDDQ